VVADRLVGREAVVTPLVAANFLALEGGTVGQVLTQTVSGVADWADASGGGGGGSACEPAYDAVIVAVPDPECPVEYATIAEAAAVEAQNILVKEDASLSSDPGFTVDTSLTVVSGVTLTLDTPSVVTTAALVIQGSGTLLLASSCNLTGTTVQLSIAQWNVNTNTLTLTSDNVTARDAQITGTTGSLTVPATAAGQTATLNNLQVLDGDTLDLVVAAKEALVNNCILNRDLTVTNSKLRITNSVFDVGTVNVSVIADSDTYLATTTFATSITLLNTVSGGAPFKATACSLGTTTLSFTTGNPTDIEITNCHCAVLSCSDATEPNSVVITSNVIAGAVAIGALGMNTQFIGNKVGANTQIGISANATFLTVQGNQIAGNMNIGGAFQTIDTATVANNVVAGSLVVTGSTMSAINIAGNVSGALNVASGGTTSSDLVVSNNLCNGGVLEVQGACSDSAFSSNVVLRIDFVTSKPATCSLTGNVGNLQTVAGAESNILVGNVGTITNFTGTEIPAGVNV